MPPPVTHRKIKPKPNKSEADIGNVILRYWESNPRWSKQTLLNELVAVLDVSGGDRKDIVFDVIIDSDIDQSTRMVWLSIPTPDLKKNPSGSDPTDWKTYSDKFKLEETDAATKLGSAVLFGCGR